MCQVRVCTHYYVSFHPVLICLNFEFRVYTIVLPSNSLYREKSDYLLFEEDFENMHYCCLAKKGMGRCKDERCSTAARKMYAERLRYIGLTRVKQSEMVLRYFRNYYNVATEQLDLIFGEWPVCAKCFFSVLGVGKKRYHALKKTWLSSDRKARRAVSKHGKKLRDSPISNFFRSYLRDLKKVPSLAVLTCDSSSMIYDRSWDFQIFTTQTSFHFLSLALADRSRCILACTCRTFRIRTPPTARSTGCLTGALKTFGRRPAVLPKLGCMSPPHPPTAAARARARKPKRSTGPRLFPPSRRRGKAKDRSSGDSKSVVTSLLTLAKSVTLSWSGTAITNAKTLDQVLNLRAQRDKHWREVKAERAVYHSFRMKNPREWLSLIIDGMDQKN